MNRSQGKHDIGHIFALKILTNKIILDIRISTILLLNVISFQFIFYHNEQ